MQNFTHGYFVTIHQLDMKEFVNVHRKRTRVQLCADAVGPWLMCEGQSSCLPDS